MKSKSIPEYFVYGEDVRRLDRDFMHVELVSERNYQHRGHVAAHKHPDMAQLTFWIKGSGTYHIEENSWIFSAPVLSFTPSNVVHGFDLAPQSDAIVLSIANDALEEIVDAGSVQAGFFTARSGSKEQWTKLKWVMQTLLGEYKAQNLDSSIALIHLAGLAFLNMKRLRKSQSVDNIKSAPQPLAQRLRAEVNASFRENFAVAYYVAKLGTTYHLLEKACHHTFGQSIKSVIIQRRLLEAKRLLKFSIRSSEDIAVELGFKDPAYFSREFKKQTGLAPGQWRRRPIGTS